MGKGKKKKANKGKKNGKKVRDDKDEGDSSTVQITMSMEQIERARLAASNRTEDPLKNWTRLQNEECPICMLPLPHKASGSNYCVTCGKTFCMGCVLSLIDAQIKDCRDANTALSQTSREKASTCPFCRSNTVVYDDKAEATLEKLMKQANTGNGEAMGRVGDYYFHGKIGLQQDMAEGVKWFHRALEAGCGNAAYDLGLCYYHGDGVDKDVDEALQCFQKAAELGYVHAFVTIGTMVMEKGEIEEGMLNYRKAVMCGLSDDILFKTLRDGFKCGYITKDEYAFTLRENQKACNEMKSEARETYKKMEADMEIQMGTPMKMDWWYV